MVFVVFLGQDATETFPAMDSAVSGPSTRKNLRSSVVRPIHTIDSDSDVQELGQVARTKVRSRKRTKKPENPNSPITVDDDSSEDAVRAPIPQSSSVLSGGDPFVAMAQEKRFGDMRKQFKEQQTRSKKESRVGHQPPFDSLRGYQPNFLNEDNASQGFALSAPYPHPSSSNARTHSTGLSDLFRPPGKNKHLLVVTERPSLDWLIDWLLDWLLDWSSNWLIAWLLDCLYLLRFHSIYWKVEFRKLFSVSFQRCSQMLMSCWRWGYFLRFFSGHHDIRQFRGRPGESPEEKPVADGEHSQFPRIRVSSLYPRRDSPRGRQGDHQGEFRLFQRQPRHERRDAVRGALQSRRLPPLGHHRSPDRAENPHVRVDPRRHGILQCDQSVPRGQAVLRPRGRHQRAHRTTSSRQTVRLDQIHRQRPDYRRGRGGNSTGHSAVGIGGGEAEKEIGEWRSDPGYGGRFGGIGRRGGRRGGGRRETGRLRDREDGNGANRGSHRSGAGNRSRWVQNVLWKCGRPGDCIEDSTAGRGDAGPESAQFVPVAGHLVVYPSAGLPRGGIRCADELSEAEFVAAGEDAAATGRGILGAGDAHCPETGGGGVKRVSFNVDIRGGGEGRGVSILWRGGMILRDRGFSNF